MKEYITGSGGFVGKHLVEHLTEPIAIPHTQIKFTTLQPFDRLFFLSAYGNMSFHSDDDKIVQANLLDLVHLAGQARKLEFKSFVYMSSSSVKLPQQTMYSRTKKAAEEVLMGYVEKHNLPFCIVRPYSITGVGEQPQHLIPTLIRSCMEGEHMTFVPEPVHDFIDVSDVVSAILSLSSQREKGIFEVGNGIGYTNQQVLELVEKITGKKANITLVSRMRDYDSENWICKSKVIGWYPKKSLEQSITEMVDEYARNRKAGL